MMMCINAIPWALLHAQVDGTREHVELLLACELHEVHSVTADADGELRVLLGMIHGVEQELTVEHVDVDGLATVGCEVTVEQRHEVCACMSFSLPRAEGAMAKVYEIPSRECWNGSLATEARAATAPFTSRAFMGLAPGANGTPFWRPSGVEPVLRPYTTLEVMVSKLWVGTALR